MKTEMQGQLWEECERCGKEPVYLPYFLCEDCWPEGPVPEKDRDDTLDQY